MRKSYLFVLPILVVLLGGCKKKITQFYVDYTTSAVIQSTFGTLVPYSVGTPEIETNSTYEFENNNTKKDRINSIFLKNLELNITSPTNETFSFVNDLEVYIDSPNNPEILIAAKNDIPNTVGDNLILDVPTTDLQEYIKDSKFSLRLKVVTDETIAQDVDIDIYSNFLVDAKIIRFKK